jgi:orotate phosphoribosyltransferase-like protein
MILREDYGMTFEQIGERLNINRSTAYLLYTRGKRNETISKDIFQVFRVR